MVTAGLRRSMPLWCGMGSRSAPLTCADSICIIPHNVRYVKRFLKIYIGNFLSKTDGLV